jgi:oligopeptide/dipeptide ABC transporter ATP-binding protein
MGRLCEVGPGESVYKHPLHPYTKALLDAIPSTEPGAARASATIKGEPPSPVSPPSGCRFRTRCPRAADICAAQEPAMRELGSGHAVACHFPLEATENTGCVPAARGEQAGAATGSTTRSG